MGRAQLQENKVIWRTLELLNFCLSEDPRAEKKHLLQSPCGAAQSWLFKWSWSNVVILFPTTDFLRSAHQVLELRLCKAGHGKRCEAAPWSLPRGLPKETPGSSQQGETTGRQRRQLSPSGPSLNASQHPPVVGVPGRNPLGTQRGRGRCWSPSRQTQRRAPGTVLEPPRSLQPLAKGTEGSGAGSSGLSTRWGWASC